MPTHSTHDAERNDTTAKAPYEIVEDDRPAPRPVELPEPDEGLADDYEPSVRGTRERPDTDNERPRRRHRYDPTELGSEDDAAGRPRRGSGRFLNRSDILYLCCGIAILFVCSIALAVGLTVHFMRQAKETVISPPKGNDAAPFRPASQAAPAREPAAAPAREPVATPPNDERLANAQDMEEYVTTLKQKVPYNVAGFLASGYKGETYVKDEELGHFRLLVIQVDPVYLKDSVTGKTALYTRAKLIRNNPPPVRINSRGGLASYPIPFEWASVVMLP